MKITVTSTTRTVTYKGVRARVWEGFTDGGMLIQCFIVRVRAHTEEARAEINRELNPDHPED
jgi:hypothetical protein